MSLEHERTRGLSVDHALGFIGKGGSPAKFPLIAAVASAVAVFPAYAGGNAILSKPEVVLAQLDLCVGPN
jgi:hypothetical protein